MLYAAERIVELATDPEITSDNFHKVPTEKPTEGVGIVEAPRGTLTHHYKTDERGILTEVNLIVGHNEQLCPNYDVDQKSLPSLIKKGTVVTEGLLNMVEMAFRAYDPCFGCATHQFTRPNATGSIHSGCKRRDHPGLEAVLLTPWEAGVHPDSNRISASPQDQPVCKP